ncbi:sulfite exporter TauE/SafE family protein [Legionella dresdenensis]|uniref:Probable membrane transporter protein n=1 Tax=Legionella dresdenensis TaxID=450200 RepID=A0ABV8CEG9_9GAMM
MISSSIVLCIIAYGLTGVVAGLMSGLLGLGGGLVVVPALATVFKYSHVVPEALAMQAASGTSLAIMVLTSKASISAHYKLGNILWHVYRRLAPGIVIGTIAGALLADSISTGWLKWIFAVFLLAVAFKMAFTDTVKLTHEFPRQWINNLMAMVIGSVSGLLGVGGGTLVIPYLSYCGVTMHEIAAVSALCTLTVAVIGSLMFAITGANEAGLPAYATGYIYWPAVIAVAIPSVLTAPVGVRLTYRLPVKQLTYGFIVILVITAINLLFI